MAPPRVYFAISTIDLNGTDSSAWYYPTSVWKHLPSSHQALVRVSPDSRCAVPFVQSVAVRSHGQVSWKTSWMYHYILRADSRWCDRYDIIWFSSHDFPWFSMIYHDRCDNYESVHPNHSISLVFLELRWFFITHHSCPGTTSTFLSGRVSTPRRPWTWRFPVVPSSSPCIATCTMRMRIGTSCLEKMDIRKPGFSWFCLSWFFFLFLLGVLSKSKLVKLQKQGDIGPFFHRRMFRFNDINKIIVRQQLRTEYRSLA